MDLLDKTSINTTKKSISSLKSHHQSNSTKNEPLYLTINTKQPFTKTKDYIPNVITLKHKLDKLENKSVLLITKDPSTPYRTHLTEKGSPTEDVFNEIMTLTKLKRLSSNQSKLVKLFKEFDIIVADFRIKKFLPTVLGSTFYARNKKIPFLIQMARPDLKAKLTKTSKSHKLKDERCDAKFVKGQMNSIARNTFTILPNGNSVAIKVAFINWDHQLILDNIDEVIKFFLGGVIKKDLIKNIQIKTSESISLPVYESIEAIPESDSDSE